MTEPVTVVTLDTAAGLVRAHAACRDGKVTSVALDFFPAFCEGLDQELEVPGLGTVTIDIAFGGVYYALVPARQLGLRITPAYARDMVDIGTRIKNAVAEQISVQHPTVPEFNQVGFVMFTEDPSAGDSAHKNATLMPPGRIDRSPCGTGSAARLAAMRARGPLRHR